MTQSLEWSSFHIYLGEYLDRSEWIVREALPAIAAGADWFFLYYTDELGAHLRFRLRGAEVDADGVEDQLNQVVAELPEREKSVVGPFVTIAGMARPLPSGRVGVRAEQYCRDMQKYRTAMVAEMAENAFVASTKLVADILAADHAARVSRKSLAPTLLWALVRLLPEDERSGFLDAYADFALRTAGATALKDNFIGAGQNARKQGLQVLLERDAIPAPISSHFDAWVHATAALLEAARQVDAVDTPSFLKLLLMDAAHISNNRLGFNFVDEAYVALLVQAQLGGPSDVD